MVSFKSAESISIGIDVVDLERFEEILRKRPNFAVRYFHPEELEAIKNRNNFNRHLAGRFAAKEAVVKAMGTGFSGFSLKEVMILNDEKGRPYVKLTGKALELSRFLKIEEFAISISFSRSTVVASAVAIKKRNRNDESAKPD
jgi:holo-[acyl-carrier protein] synthase